MPDRSATSLTKFANSMRDPDPDGARRAADQLWRDKQIAVIFPDECHGLDWDFVKAVANKFRGRR